VQCPSELRLSGLSQSATQSSLPASSASEAFLVVSASQGGNHFPFDVLVADGAFGPKLPLVISGAVISAILTEETALSQRVSTHCNKIASNQQNELWNRIQKLSRLSTLHYFPLNLLKGQKFNGNPKIVSLLEENFVRMKLLFI